jgi:hypothetical protein
MVLEAAVELSLFIFLLAGAAALVWAWRSHLPARDADGEFCSNCGYDLRASTGRCPECGQPFTRAADHIPLRDDWPADPISPRRPGAAEVPVCIHTTDIEWQARTLREQFEARGIAAQIQEPGAVPMNPYTGVPIRGRGSWRVMVWSEDAELAAAIRDKLIPHRPPVSEDT